MKKILLVLVAVVFLAGMSWSEGEANEAKLLGALSFEVGGSFVAPMGVGVEFFLGPVSLGAELRFFYWMFDKVGVITLDPGATVRVFFSGLDSSMYIFAGASYLTGFAVSGGQSTGAPFGLLKPKAGLGYGALFGKKNNVRFAVELGAVYFVPMFEGSVLSTVDFPSMIMPHLLIMFGRAF
jgi:hypothetical protein